MLEILHSYRTLFALKRIFLPPNSTEFPFLFSLHLIWPKNKNCFEFLTFAFWSEFTKPQVIDWNLSEICLRCVSFMLDFLFASWCWWIKRSMWIQTNYDKIYNLLHFFCHHNIMYLKKKKSILLPSIDVFEAKNWCIFWFQEKIQYKFSLWL